MPKPSLPASALFVLAVLVPAFAQNDVPPAYVAVLDGDVTLIRDGQPSPAPVNMPVVAGDRLVTAAGGAEVLFPDGTALDMDQGTVSDFTSVGGDVLVRLSAGRVVLVVPPGPSPAAHYRIDTPSGSVVPHRAGKYRADAAGVTAWANAGTNDGFDGWSDGLRAARNTAASSPSADHLPAELQTYDSTLDQSGTWQYAPTYGYVWYPRVDTEWRPYYQGSWAAVPAYGWTWIGVNRWEYPTHHYGRWGYANNRWFWIPGRAYSPAWVAWGYAPEYVTWCPLGIDSRPVFAMTVGYGNPWAGWTVVSRSHFGGLSYVPRVAVAPQQVPIQTPFVVQRAAPSLAWPSAMPRTVPAPTAPGVPLPPVPATATRVAPQRTPASESAPPPAGRASPASQPQAPHSPSTPAARGNPGSTSPPPRSGAMPTEHRSGGAGAGGAAAAPRPAAPAGSTQTPPPKAGDAKPAEGAKARGGRSGR